MELKVSDLSKSYGTHKAIHHLNFTLQKSKITGFIGPNGAGKTTTFKILTGLIKPSGGKVCDANDQNIDLHSLDFKRKVGYLPENNPLYKEMYIRDFLTFSAGMYGKQYLANIDKVIELTGLYEVRKKKISQLSKGYRQRVGIAQAIIHDPEIIILDEPTSGLDPNQLVEIRKIIKDLGQNKTVILSSHIMAEVENICEHIVIIDKGLIVLDNSKEEAKKMFGGVFKIELSLENEVDAKLWEKLKQIVKIEQKPGHSWEFFAQKDIRLDISDICNEQHLRILSLRLVENDMEQIFHTVTR